MSEPVVTMKHIRDAKLCSRGARAWAQRHGFDYAHFLKHGYPASVFEATGDIYGMRVAAIAREQAAQEKK